jgi:hypothetical protein
MPLKHLQHMQHPRSTFAISIRNNYNIPLKLLKHLNIHLQHRGGGLGWSIMAVGVGAGGERRRASTTSIRPCSWVLLVRPGTIRGAPTRAPSNHRQGWLRRGILTALGLGKRPGRCSAVSGCEIEMKRCVESRGSARA